MKAIDRESYYMMFDYDNQISNNKEKKYEKALERAWKNRDFEIEMYWKRANYFWLFMASTFTGYFALSLSINDNPFYMLVIICIGIFLSVCWILVNRGSKKWQENWEAHIDMLEDKVTGPIYKIVKDKKGYNYSVSKINELVSWYVLCIWIIFFIYQILNSIPKIVDNTIFIKIKLDSLICYLVLIIGTIVFIIMLFFKKCKTSIENKIYNFGIREFDTK